MSCCSPHVYTLVVIITNTVHTWLLLSILPGPQYVKFVTRQEMYIKEEIFCWWEELVFITIQGFSFESFESCYTCTCCILRYLIIQQQRRVPKCAHTTHYFYINNWYSVAHIYITSNGLHFFAFDQIFRTIFVILLLHVKSGYVPVASRPFKTNDL